MFVRRVGFPAVLLLFVAGLGALFYLAPEIGTGQEAARRLFGAGEETPSTLPSIPPDRPTDRDADNTEDAERGTTLDLELDTASAGEEAGGLGAGYAHLSVFSEPSGATVLVDSDSIGVTPVNRHALRSGVYIITVQRDNFSSADTVAILRSDQAPVYSVVLDPRPELPPLAEQRTWEEDPASSPLPEETPPSAEVPVSDEPPPAPEEEGPEPDASESEAASESEEASEPEAEASPEPAAPVPTTGTLRFASEPTGARVELDGEVVGTTPLTLDEVEAGAYEVTVTRSGYDTLQTAVTLAPQEEREVEATLNELMGRLRVLVQPWGSIYIGGQLHERNADVRYETQVPVGEHEVVAVHPSLGRQTRTVTVRAGEQVSLTIDLRTPSSEDTSSNSNRP